MTVSCLCIGGPYDGKYIVFNGQKKFNVAISRANPVELSDGATYINDTRSYRLETFGVHHALYLFDHMTREEAMSRLVACYSPSKGEWR